MTKLYTTKEECCGCTACMNICKKQAISMESDIDGFMYPIVNNDLCVECGLCKTVCAFQNEPVTYTKPLATYAAANRNQSVLTLSASGGVFAALASVVFEKGGVVFGCAFNHDMVPEHICVDNLIDMKKLQGSKYVQSSINTTYAKSRKFLKEGRWVLFTGTPCQIAGLKSYLGKDYNTLITADLICHGVPSVALFKGYIKHLEAKLNGKVIDFKFREKSKGGGYLGKVFYEKNGVVRKKFIPSYISYYYSYFLKGDIFRENCYKCKYASGSRQGDFTMGDYWGIENAHPEINNRNGVSVLLVNSIKGMDIIENLTKLLTLTKSTFEQARVQNNQLRQPTVKSDRRELILKMWREGGYQALGDEYRKLNKKQLMVFRLKMLVPQSAKRLLKKLLRRV